MRLHEIDKATFQKKLQYEWLEELLIRVRNFNEHYGKAQWEAKVFTDENPIRIQLKRDGSGTVNTMTLHTAEIWFAQMVLGPLAVDYPVDFKEIDKQPRSQTESPSITYTAKPRVSEAKLSKDEFVQRLQDPRKAALEDKLKEWDDILRNRLGWRLDWSTWDIDPNVVTVTAYKPRTLPYPTTTVEDVRSNLWSFLLQDRWDEKNDIQITFEDEDETSVTWEFELTD